MCVGVRGKGGVIHVAVILFACVYICRKHRREHRREHRKIKIWGY